MHTDPRTPLQHEARHPGDQRRDAGDPAGHPASKPDSQAGLGRALPEWLHRRVQFSLPGWAIAVAATLLILVAID